VLLDIYPGEMEIMFTQSLYMNVHNLFIHSSPKLEVMELSFKQTVDIHTTEDYSAAKGMSC